MTWRHLRSRVLDSICSIAFFGLVELRNKDLSSIRCTISMNYLGTRACHLTPGGGKEPQLGKWVFFVGAAGHILNESSKGQLKDWRAEQSFRT